MANLELQFRSVTLQLYNDLAYPWHIGTNGCVRGYAFHGDTLLQGQSLLAYMADCTELSQMEQRLQQLNGFFNVILQLEDAVVAAVDPVSSMPLFYTAGPTMLICDGIRQPLLKSSTPFLQALGTAKYTISTKGRK